MARKDVFVSRISHNQSLAASFNGPATVIKYLDNLAYQINITTSNSTGNFSVQGSLDYSVNPLTGIVESAGSWVTLNLAGGTPTVAAANDTIAIDLNQLPYTAIRIVYTASVAGTGTCDIWISGRQIGG
jgi:hypothetical protein